MYNRVLEKKRVEKMNRHDGGMDEVNAGIEVTRVDILDVEGNPVHEARTNQPLVIRVKYTAYKDFGKSNAIILIHRSDGLLCCNIRTHLDHFPMSIEKGEGEYFLKIDPSQLFGSMYYVESWIMNADDSDGIAFGASEWFEVRNSIQGHEANMAVFEPNRAWGQNRISQNERAVARPTA